MSPFNIKTDDIGEFARRMLDRKGIDPDVPPSGEYTIADHLADSYDAKLAMLTPARFHGAQVTDRRVDDWIARYLDDPTSAPNLLLTGPVGSGKTHNAFAALRTIAHTAARRTQRMTFSKVSHADFNQAMRPTADDSHLAALADYQTVDLLLFDDLGAGQVTAWAEDTLFRLVDVRWSEQRPTILTSNLDATSMKSLVDERVRSRLSGAIQIDLDNRDHRRTAR